MVELNKKIIGGIVVLIIALASGTTYYLQETGNYNNCRGKWILQETGEYLCEAKEELEWCYDIEYRGSGWYRCWIGKITRIEEAKEIISEIKGTRYICDNQECKVI